MHLYSWRIPNTNPARTWRDYYGFIGYHHLRSCTRYWLVHHDPVRYLSVIPFVPSVHHPISPKISHLNALNIDYQLFGLYSIREKSVYDSPPENRFFSENFRENDAGTFVEIRTHNLCLGGYRLSRCPITFPFLVNTFLRQRHILTSAIALQIRALID